MSKLLLSKYNGTLPKDFNIIDWQATTIFADTIISTDINGFSVQGNSIGIVNDSGTPDDVATKSYVDGKIEDLLGTDNLNTSLNTILEINEAINNDPNFYTTITTSIATKANDNDVMHLTTNESIAGQKTFSTGITLNGSDLNTRLSSDEATISSHTTSIATKANDNAVVHLTTNESISGQKTFSTGITLNGTDLNTRLTSDESTISSHTTSIGSLNTSVSALNAKTGSLTYNSGTNTTTLNSKLVVALDESTNGNTTIGDASTDTLTVKASTTFQAGVSGITKTMVGLSNVDNTTDVGKPISTATQTALNLKANQTSLDTTNSNILALQNKTNALSYDVSSNSTTLNSKLIVALDESTNGNTTIGDASTDSLTVKATTTFQAGVSGITKSMVGLSNVDNTADTNKPISSATQTALNLKADDSSVVKLSGNQTISNIKTFSSSPIVPTCTSGDNSTKVASTQYVDSSIANLINSAPTALDTLNELASALGNDASFSTTVTNSLAGKASLTGNNTYTGNQTYNVGSVSYTNGLSTNAITLNSVNLDTRIGNIEGKTSKISYDSGTDSLTIASKMVVSKDVSNIGSIYLGDSSGNDIIYLNGNISSNSQTITPVQLGYLSGASSNLQTQIGSKADDSAVVKLTGSQTIGGIKTFSSIPVLPSNSITDSNIINTCIHNGYCDGTSSIQNQLDSKASDSLSCHLAGTENITGPKTFSGGVTLSSNITANGATITPTELSYIDTVSSNIQTQLNGKQASLTFDTTPTTSSTNPVTSGGVYTSLQNYLTTSSASSTYAGLSSANTLSGNNTLSGTNSIKLINEQVNYVSGVTTALSLDYTTLKGINYIATPSSNFSLALTNVPTGSTNACYQITLLMAVKYYANSCTINGTSRTIIAGNGASNISINASATYVLQTIAVMFLNSSTPIVVSNVLSIW
jgi:hypothetical protein